LERLHQERRQKWEEAELAKYEAKGKKPPKGWEKQFPVHENPTPEQLEPFPSLPQGWTYDLLENICDPSRPICYGVIKLGNDFPNGVPCLRTSNVRPLRIDIDAVKTISPKISQNYERTVLQGGEVLVNVRGTLGGIAVVPISMKGWNISREVAMAAVSPHIFSEYIALAIASYYSQNWLTGVLKGVAYTGINIADLKRLPVPIPPLDEQKEIVRDFYSRFRRVTGVFRSMKESHRDLETLTQSLLAKAFRGELVPQDPNDEPASELLARIREEREKKAPAKKAKKAK
ncbi:MAG: restriction endonuclease subunit S, partial [Verrucomicrobiales bacterium]|nr:restriction endonuclease subunit S [Verrucomicrobiales bacterium]